MKRTLVVVALALCGGAPIALLLEYGKSSPVFAAARASQQQSELPQAKPQQQPETPPSGQEPGKIVLEPIQTGKPLSPLGMAEWAIFGLQGQVKKLQDQTGELQNQVKTLESQAATDQAAIHTLQASLQTLQTQFANHSHVASVTLPGHDCMKFGNWYINSADDHQMHTVAFYVEGACQNPGQLSITGPTEAVHVGLPTQGAN